MKNLFVAVSNYERFLEGIKEVELRGAREASLMLVTSQAGYGKTATLDYWATQVGATRLRAKVQWTPRYFLTELAADLNVMASGKTIEIFRAVGTELGRRGTPLIVDELNHCLQRGGAVLEAIRDLSDLTEVIVVLAGHEDVQSKIARYPQIRSRIAHVCRFEPASADDIRALAGGLIDAKLDDDLVEEIRRQSAGRTREIMNALAACERAAHAAGEKRMAAKDMVGRRMVFEWQGPRVGGGPRGDGA